MRALIVWFHSTIFRFRKPARKFLECDEHFAARFPFITVDTPARQPLIHLVEETPTGGCRYKAAKQSSTKRRIKMRLTKQIIVITAALVATISLVSGQGQQVAESAGSRSIVGTWQVVRHAVDCTSGQQLGPDFKVLMTFNGGGTLNAFGVPTDGSTPANTSPEYGNWHRESGPGNFSFRDISYKYDSTGANTGSGVLTATIKLAADGNTFMQQTMIDIYDADGNLLFSFCGAANGTRFQ